MSFKLTNEQRQISRRNQTKTWRELGYSEHKSLVLHHIDESLRHNDIERYIEWRPEDVVVMTNSEHTAFHNHEQKGKPKSERAKQITSEAIKKSYENGRIPASQGKHWFNNGLIETYSFTCPEGYIKGRLPGQGGKKKGDGAGRRWFTNGDTSVWAYECPEGFVSGRGRLKRYADLTQKEV